MSKICQVTGKKPMSGNHVSHAKNKVKRKFFPNLHTKRFWLSAQSRFITLKVSTQGLRIVDKLGIENVLKRINKRKGAK